MRTTNILKKFHYFIILDKCMIGYYIFSNHRQNERLAYLVAEAAKNMYQTYFAQLRPRTFPTERLSNQLDTLKKVTKHQNIPEIEELSERLNQVRQVMLDLDHS